MDNTTINSEPLTSRQKSLAACACVMAQGDLPKLENEVRSALNPGDVIDIPEGAKHWHGAQKDSWFQHIATHIATGGKESNEWLEAVSDEEYNKL